MIYAKKALQDRKIPFEITASANPFYLELNLAQIKKADRQVKNAYVVEKTMEELEAMELN